VIILENLGWIISYLAAGLKSRGSMTSNDMGW
jgi:hypothetical protein